MNKTLEILKSIYKPYKYTIKGKATILETMTGEYIIKEKDKDLKDLYKKTRSEGFGAEVMSMSLNMSQIPKDLNLKNLMI